MTLRSGSSEAGTAPAISILLADDHQIVRDALAHYLDANPRLEVVAAVSSHAEAITESERHSPDVALLDIEVPGLDCFAAARTIAARSPGTRVILLSAFCRDVYIERALDAGAVGYLVKGENSALLIDAIEAVMEGRTYFSEQVEDRLVVDEKGLRLSAGPTRVSSLTSRELEILRYVAVGMSKKEIADLASVSVRTVDAHVRNIMAKLDLHDRVALARFAIREGLAPE